MKAYEGKTILVVDDEEQIREFIRDEFEFEGARVLEAANGRLGMQLAAAEPIDCIISDIRMPGGDGTELLDAVRQDGQTFPIVLFISGFSEITVDEAFERGMNGFFPKPFNTSYLLIKARELLYPFAERVRRGEKEQGERRICKTLILSPEVEKNVSFGSGGMFLATTDRHDFALGKVVLDLTFSGFGEPFKLSGMGCVHWARKTDKGAHLPAGIGVEFTYLTPESLAFVLAQQPVKTKAFIPNGLNVPQSPN